MKLPGSCPLHASGIATGSPENWQGRFADRPNLSCNISVGGFSTRVCPSPNVCEPLLAASAACQTTPRAFVLGIPLTSQWNSSTVGILYVWLCPVIRTFTRTDHLLVESYAFSGSETFDSDSISCECEVQKYTIYKARGRICSAKEN